MCLCISCSGTIAPWISLFVCSEDRSRLAVERCDAALAVCATHLELAQRGSCCITVEAREVSFDSLVLAHHCWTSNCEIEDGRSSQIDDEFLSQRRMYIALLGSKQYCNRRSPHARHSCHLCLHLHAYTCAEHEIPAQVTVAVYLLDHCVQDLNRQQKDSNKLDSPSRTTNLRLLRLVMAQCHPCRAT